MIGRSRPDRPRKRTEWWAALLALFVLSTGCGDDVRISSLEADRPSWDTLVVSISVSSRGFAGSDHSVSTGDKVFRLFDADFQLVYEGDASVISVPDHLLASEERFVLEACVSAEEETLCEQRMFEASPKRVVFREGVTYPAAGHYDRGSYAFDFVVERQSMNAASWEPLPGASIRDAYLVATVEGYPETSVRAPVTASRGAFDLRGDPNFDEFEFRLLRGLQRGDAVSVRFDLFTEQMASDEPLASVERLVREKTNEQREDELEMYVRRAAEQVLARFEPYDRARARVLDWAFDPEVRRYRIQIRLSWGGAFFDRRTVLGELGVNEDGSDATFRQEGMNRSARRAWGETVGTQSVALDPLGSNQVGEDGETPNEPLIARRL